MKPLFIYLSKLAVGLLCVNAYASNHLPLNNFYQDPIVSKVILSPDGKKFAAMTSLDGQLAIMIHDFSSEKTVYPIKFDSENSAINWLKWAENNQHVLVSIASFNQNKDRIYKENRLISVTAEKPGTTVSLYTPNHAIAKKFPFWSSSFQDNIICSTPAQPDYIWLSVDRDLPGSKALYKVNVNDGKMTLEQRERKSIKEWYMDRECNLRMSQSTPDSNDQITFKYKDEKGKWKDAWSYKTKNDSPRLPLGFSGNSYVVYTNGSHEDKHAIYKVNLLSKADKPELVYSDIENLMSAKLEYSHKINDILGVRSWIPEMLSIPLHESLIKLKANIDRALPKRENTILNLSRDGQRYVVYSKGINNFEQYILGDSSTGKLSLLADAYPTVTKNHIPKSEWVNFDFSDNTIGGIFTESLKGTSETTPLIVIFEPFKLHEGILLPDMFTTYLANKGYAVYQPDPRVFSKNHSIQDPRMSRFTPEAIHHYQQAINQLAKTKNIDLKRVCIIGMSEGGYGALMASTIFPDLYRCVVSVDGKTNLTRESTFTYDGQSQSFNESLGQSKNSEITSLSPIFHSSSIKSPVLLIYQKNASLISVEHGREMANKLKEEKKVYEYIEIDSLQSLKTSEHNRKIMYEAIDNFLDRYMPLK